MEGREPHEAHDEDVHIRMLGQRAPLPVKKPVDIINLNHVDCEISSNVYAYRVGQTLLRDMSERYRESRGHGTKRHVSS